MRSALQASAPPAGFPAGLDGAADFSVGSGSQCRTGDFERRRVGQAVGCSEFTHGGGYCLSFGGADRVERRHCFGVALLLFEFLLLGSFAALLFELFGARLIVEHEADDDGRHQHYAQNGILVHSNVFFYIKALEFFVKGWGRCRQALAARSLR